MTLLETVEASLKDFRPKTLRQFVVFNIASRFDDLPSLARYLNVCHHPKKRLIEAARLAEEKAIREGVNRSAAFFQLLQDWERREAA